MWALIIPDRLQLQMVTDETFSMVCVSLDVSHSLECRSVSFDLYFIDIYIADGYDLCIGYNMPGVCVFFKMLGLGIWSDPYLVYFHDCSIIKLTYLACFVLFGVIYECLWRK